MRITVIQSEHAILWQSEESRNALKIALIRQSATLAELV